MRTKGSAPERLSSCWLDEEEEGLRERERESYVRVCSLVIVKVIGGRRTLKKDKCIVAAQSRRCTCECVASFLLLKNYILCRAWDSIPFLRIWIKIIQN